MAELVLQRIDNTSSNLTTNTKGCYKQGDIIAVLEDGLADTMPWLTVIKVPGLGVKDAKKEFIVFSETVRSRYHLPETLMNQLFPKTTMQCSIPLIQWNTWKTKILDKLV